MRSYLDFEKPVAELDAKLDELRALAASGSEIGDEIASTVVWLAGPGGRYITGQTLHVNGGAYLGS